MGLGQDFYRHGRRFVGHAYARCDRAIDAGQAQAMRVLWLFLPESSIAREARFQQVLVSRFFSDVGQQALAYGVLVNAVRSGGSAFDAALLGAAAIAPPALLGLYGGAVADALPKRIALAMVYNFQAVLCFLTPSLLGTSVPAMMLLLFAVNTLGQVSGPTEQTVIPLVASDNQLASAASLIGLASAVGTAFGAALLAPILLRLFGVTVVLYAAGVFLLVAATRVIDLSAGDKHHFRPRAVDFAPRVRAVETLRWLASEPAIASMVFVAVLAGTAQIVVQTLAPRYVQASLGVDASNAVYVFAPTALGLVAALFAMPRLISVFGERASTLVGFLAITLSLFALGMIEYVSPVVDPFNPARLLAFADLDLSARLRTAALLAIPLGFGVSLSTTSVQTYVNRRVPHHLQARTFAVKTMLKHGTAILPLTTLGLAAEAFGVERVLVAAPFVLLGAAYALVQVSSYFAGHEPRRGLDVFASYWEEPPPDLAASAP
jgi:MFS family permease